MFRLFPFFRGVAALAVVLPNLAAHAEPLFTIVPGVIPHVVLTQNAAVDFAVDRYGADGWTVVVHYPRGSGYVALGEVGQPVNDNLFCSDLYAVEGKGDVFRVAFRWWDNCVSPTLCCYGWFTLGMVRGEPVVFAGEADDSQNATVVGRGEQDAPTPLDFKVEEFSDYVALSWDCVPYDAVGRVVIPAVLRGKPVRVIGDNAFGGMYEGITGISIPTSVVSIGSGAFHGCSALRELEIPESVTNVGDGVVSGCMALGDVRIKAALPTFGYKAFAHTGMTNLVLSLGITNIDNYAFADNRELKTVTIPQSVERIGTWSFDENCLVLKSVSVPWATVVEDEAFPPDCKVARYGPNICLSGDLAKPDDETKMALMRTLDWRDYASKMGVQFLESDRSEEALPRTAPYACAHLGISPVALESEEGWNHVTAYYGMPTVRILRFDRENRTLTAQVAPPEGSRVVSMPTLRAFGFERLVGFGTKDQYAKDSSGSYLNGEEGYEIDTADYVRSNGLFRLTFPARWYEADERGTGVFLRVRLKDYRHALW